MRVALVHDYLTQRGGAERVVLAMLRAFPEATLYTSLFDAESTFPEFARLQVRTLPINRVPGLRKRHRLAYPVLDRSFSHFEVDADVVLCSSSGWAHGVEARGEKIVYCYSPARWLYEPDRYFGRSHRTLGRLALAALRSRLLAWDRAAARTAARYLAVSEATRAKVRDAYGIEAEVVYPPPGLTPAGPARAPSGIAAGYFLCVARLLPYKNVAAVVDAFGSRDGRRLVVVGSGPEERRLRRHASANVSLVGPVPDAALRWLYANAAAVVSAAYDDYGLTAIEAASFGKPCVALRAGGLLETVREGETGFFFGEPERDAIREAIEAVAASTFDEDALHRHAEQFSEARFRDRLRTVVSEVACADPHDRTVTGAPAGGPAFRLKTSSGRS
jgi:glycosyltransferase involved in cell wall biosynthesis